MVAVNDPGAPLSGVATVSATASDAETAVASVSLEFAAAGSSTWVPLCSTASEPYACLWDTTLYADGSYQLRAHSTDIDGNSRISEILVVDIANTAGVVLSTVPSPTRGATISLSAQLVNPPSGGSQSITFRSLPSGSGSYTTIAGCSFSGLSATCPAAFADGVYDVQVQGNAKNQTYFDTQTGITVDNTAPSISLTTPSGPLSGAVALAASASDALSGVDAVAFEVRASGGAWTSCGVDSASPYICSLDTTTLADGTYDFRATASDAAGNATTTATVSRLVDNTDPTVALTVPPGPLGGTVTLTATATDAASGVASVQFQHRLQGAGSWSSCGTDNSSPYSCDLNTSTLTNGTHEFRAIATDGAGRTATTAVQTRVVQSVGLALAALPAAIKATTTLTATWEGSPSTAVAFEYQTSAGSSWTTITGCGAVSASPTATCSWNPSTLTDGSFDVRARTTYQSVEYAPTRTTVVDKTAPSAVTLTVPAAPLNGTVDLAATASDATSGIGSVLFEYKLSSGSTWVACGTDTSTPYSCALDTTTLTDANYDFRATGADLAGNIRVSTTATRAVNSAVSSVSITSPVSGASVLGTTTVTTNATSTKAITNVVIQYKTGTGAWTTICTDTSSPYSCSWNTSTFAYGSYQLQAVLTQANGYTATSAAVPISVERFRGFSVDATPGTTVGSPGAGDTVVLTYTSTASLTTIKPGWSGASVVVPVTLNDSRITGGPVFGEDWMAFPGTNLGTVSFGQDYVGNNGTVTFGDATMVATTITVNGRNATQITVSLNAATGSANKLNSTGTATGTMRWVPSAIVTDTTGTAAMTETVVEALPVDADL